MKTENNKIIVSNIACRADSFREKVDEVHTHLEEICAEKDMSLTTHSNINPKRQLNKSRLHLSDSDMVTSCELQAESLKAQVEIQKCELESMSYEFESTSYEFLFTSHEFKSTTYEFKSTNH